ncbi:MAG: hypothetical protein ACOCUT_01000 [bacterium]
MGKNKKRSKKNNFQQYIVTTAQACVRPHKRFLEGLERYANDNNVEDIHIIPTFGQDASERDLHSAFSGFTIIDKEFHYNNSIKAQHRRIRPQMIDPATGMAHVVRDGKSVIFESPQIRFKTVPTVPSKQPKFLTTTGAVTLPNYASSTDSAAERQRLGLIAKDNHMYGAILVQVINSQRYHIRHLHANNKGEFVDLGVAYDGNTIRDAKCKALIYGDWHHGVGLKQNYDASFEQARYLQPEVGVLHDIFDGHSVNPYVQKEFIYQQIRQGVHKGHLKLEQELIGCGKDIMKLSGLHKLLVIDPANHHNFLDRWLDEGRFMRDPSNAELGFKLAQAYAQGADPVEEGMKLVGHKFPSHVKFLKPGESFRVKGYELGQHGHQGGNGSRGSLKQREHMYGKSIVGHSHSPEDYRYAHIVGTHVPRDIFYAKGGPSGWLARNMTIYDTGTTQGINTIDGEWNLK